MILPQYQKYGYGRFLIEFSYLLSKEENSLGGPEKPLSDLGMISYMNYWKYKILKTIYDLDEISIDEISQHTNMTSADIMSALNYWKMVKRRNGENQDVIYIHKKDIEKMKQPRLNVNPQDLRWTKFVSHFLPRALLQNDEDAMSDSTLIIDV